MHKRVKRIKSNLFELECKIKKGESSKLLTTISSDLLHEIFALNNTCQNVHCLRAFSHINSVLRTVKSGSYDKTAVCGRVDIASKLMDRVKDAN